MRTPLTRLAGAAQAVAAATISCHPASNSAAVQNDAATAAPRTPLAASAPPALTTTAPNALPTPSANVDALVNPSHLPAYDGPTGSVEGTVFVRGPEAPDLPALDVK